MTARRYHVAVSPCRVCGGDHVHPSALPGPLGATPGGDGCAFFLRHTLVVDPPRRPGGPTFARLVAPPDEAPAPEPINMTAALAALHAEAVAGAKAKEQNW